MQGDQLTPDGRYDYQSGVSLAVIDMPAQMAAFGETYDTPRYAFSPIDSIPNKYRGGKHNGSLRHGGQFNVNFVHAHAKSVRFKFGDAGGLSQYEYNDPNRYGLSPTVAFPKDINMRLMF